MKMSRVLPVAVIAVVLVACGVAEQDKAAHTAALHDSWLDGKVETTLLFNPNLNSFDVHTQVKDGVVTLTGAVKNDIQKQLADELASDIQGVTKVDNQLTVSDQASLSQEMVKELTDAKIATVVKSRLIINPGISESSIHVSVKDGIVSLNGSVPDGKMKDLAGVLAQKTHDVQSVDNNLQIVSMQS